MARPEDYRGECSLCGGIFTARDLDKIYIRRGTYGRLATVAATCQNCTARLADYLGQELPDLDAQHFRRGPGSYCPACMTVVSQRDRFCRHCGEKLEDNPWADEDAWRTRVLGQPYRREEEAR